MSEEEFYKKLRHNFFGTEDSEDFKELVKAYDDKSKKLELYKAIIKEVREIFKYYGTKEDIVGYSNYTIIGEELIKLLEILEKVEEK